MQLVPCMNSQCLAAWQPLAFFSQQLCSNERKYSTFNLELLSNYLVILHFRFLLEAWSFTRLSWWTLVVSWSTFQWTASIQPIWIWTNPLGWLNPRSEVVLQTFPHDATKLLRRLLWALQSLFWFYRAILDR